MRKIRSGRLLSILALALGSSVASAQKQDLPREVYYAWARAGARPGFLGPASGWSTLKFGSKAELDAEHVLPGFSISKWRDGMLDKLPAVPIPFGLDVQASGITDKALGELARVEKLAALNLKKTAVTDAGLKELVGIKELAYLDLAETPVTDAGLKEVARLKQLRLLNLEGSRVTAAGLKQLAGL